MRASRLKRRRATDGRYAGISSAIIRDLRLLEAHPGVTSVSLGFKERAGRLGRRLCVKVYVVKKVSPAKLGDRILPKFTWVLWPDGPRMYRLRRLPTDVVQVRRLRLAAGAKAIYAQIPVGAQIGPASPIYAPGSHGCLVRRTSDGADLLMTAAHVITKATGPVVTNRMVYQADRLELPCRVGRVVDGHFGNEPTVQAFLDVAFYEVTENSRTAVNRSWDGAITKIDSPLSIAEIRAEGIGMRKVGAVTGESTAALVTFHETYVDPTLGTLKRVFEFGSTTGAAVIAAGDSGSVAVSSATASRNALIGVVFAKSTDCKKIFVVPFESIQKAFGVNVP